MNLQHIAFKIFVDGELTVDWEQFINVFHTWVAEQSMPEMMMTSQTIGMSPMALA